MRPARTLAVTEPSAGTLLATALLFSALAAVLLLCVKHRPKKHLSDAAQERGQEKSADAAAPAAGALPTAGEATTATKAKPSMFVLPSSCKLLNAVLPMWYMPSETVHSLNGGHCLKTGTTVQVR